MAPLGPVPEAGPLARLTRLETLVIALRRYVCDVAFALASLAARPLRPVVCPALHTLVVFLEEKVQLVELKKLVEGRARAGYPVRRLVVAPLDSAGAEELCEHARRMTVRGVEELKVIMYGNVPKEACWQDAAPPGCWDKAYEHRYWPMWPSETDI